MPARARGGGGVAEAFGSAESVTRALARESYLADRGLATSVYLAASREVEGVTGGYFVGRRQTRSSPASYDTALQQRLWDESARLTALTAATAP